LREDEEGFAVGAEAWGLSGDIAGGRRERVKFLKLEAMEN
jgi:hypothetical protein